MTDTLYGAPLSLYSGKARAYMDWKGVDYREELARADVYRDIIVPAVGRPVIPVLRLADGTVIQDTTKIIDHYEAAGEGPSVYPDTPLQRLVALLFEVYGDEWLVIPAMHYRWNYNEEWAYSEFGKAAFPDAPPEVQYEKGKARAQPFKGFCPVLGINETTIPALEASYEDLLAELSAHFENHDYLLGSRPSIGDYGLIGPLYAHLYRDPASGEIMKRLAPRVAAWVERCVHVAAPRSGEFLPGDTVPDTLLPILQRMMAEMMPHLQASAKLLAGWAAANPGGEVPRATGMAPFTLAGPDGAPVEGQRMANTFSLWMLQRPLDFYRSLEGETKAQADALLAGVGGAAFTGFDLPQRVDFIDHRIVLAN